MSSENRFSAPDLERLLAFSGRLRSFMAMLHRNPHRVGTAEAQHAFRALCDDVRLDLRVRTDFPPGVVEPRNESAALAYMRAPRFLLTTHRQRVREYVNRGAVEPRTLLTVDRVVADARKVGVPLYLQALDAPDTVHLGHATERLLPWACWDLIADWVYQAGIATNYRFEAAGTVPGQFRLSPDTPELSDKERGTRPKKLDPEESEVERGALWRYFSGGEWETHPFDAEWDGEVGHA